MLVYYLTKILTYSTLKLKCIVMHCYWLDFVNVNADLWNSFNPTSSLLEVFGKQEYLV